MKRIKKILFLVGLLIIPILLTSCEVDKIESFNVSYKEDASHYLNEGEELDLNLFNFTVNYKDGTKKVLEEYEHYLVKHNYKTNLKFNHEEAENEVVFEVTFKYKRVASNVIAINIVKDEVREVSIQEYGKVDYIYGEEFDASGFKLFVRYYNKPNQIIDLDVSMLAMESKYVKPASAGAYTVAIFYHGVEANAPLTLTVDKAEQVLLEKDVKVMNISSYEIELKELSNALYKFYPEGANPDNFEWQVSPSYTHDEPITTKMNVLVKLDETLQFKESNIISLEGIDVSPYHLKPIFVHKSDTAITFRNPNNGYQVVLIDLFEFDIIDDVEPTITQDNYAVFSGLLPNHSYLFALKKIDSNKVYEVNRLGEPIKTNQTTNPLTYIENQTYVYNNQERPFQYNKKENYQNIDVNVVYKLNGEVVETPIDVGLYDVEVTTNASDKVFLGTLKIVKREITITVNDQEKRYLDSDPAFSLNNDFTFNEQLVSNKDTFSITSFREEGEQVGTYVLDATITNPNYNITVVPGTLTIKKKEITAKINNLAITYGNKLEGVTYSFIGGEPSFYDEDHDNEFLFTYYQANEENVNYQQAAYQNEIEGTLINRNYQVNLLPGDLTIQKRDIEVTIDAKTKIYGDNDPVFTYQLSEEKYRNELAIELRRNSGENATYYQIYIGNKNDNNFRIIETRNNLTIEKATLLVVPNSNQRKTYDNQDPTFSFNATGFKNGDDESIFRGNLSREVGPDVGSYLITLGNFTAGGNYNINFVDNVTFDIVKRDITVTINNKTKVYGNPEVALTFDLSEGKYRNELAISLKREAGENVANYSIGIDSVNDKNFNVSEIKGNYKIEKANLIVTPQAGQSKIYGDLDPVILFTATGYKLGDNENIFIGTLSRFDGEIVGNYEITLGSLNTDNYNVILSSTIRTFEIQKRRLQLSIDEKNKTYGEEDEELTFNLDEELYRKELNVVLKRNEGEDVNNYLIYVLSYDNTNIELEIDINYYHIRQKEIEVSINNYELVYGTLLEDEIEKLSFVINLNDLEYHDSKDEFTITYNLNNDFIYNVGSYEKVLKGSISHNNYLVTVIEGNLDVVRKDVTVYPVEKVYHKTYGEEDDFVFEYISIGVVEDGSNLQGSLSRISGEDVNSYLITQGTLTTENNPNYTIIYDDSFEAYLKINKAVLTVLPDEVYQIYGDNETTLTYQAFGEQFSEDISLLVSGYLTREEGINVGSYQILGNNLLVDDNYELNYVLSYYKITPREINIVYEKEGIFVYGEDYLIKASSNDLAYDDELQISLITDYAGSHTSTVSLKDDKDGNYIIVNNSYQFDVEKREVTLTVTSGSKVYGEETPKAYTETGEYKPVDEYEVTYELSSENVDDNNTLTITSTTLNENNYIVKIVPANITVTPATLTITPNDNQSKVYGEDEPVFTYGVSGYKLGDKDLVSGSLSRVEGKDANTYEILQGDLKLISNNYTLLFVSDVVFKIEKREVTLTVTSGSKVYGEETPKAYTETGKYKPVDEYEVTYKLSSENVDDNNTLTITSTTLNENNYNVKIVPANITITPATLTITPKDNQSKVYGEDDPIFTYEVSGYKLGDKDLVTGSLSRVEGKDANTYEILQGDLKLISNNYTLLFVSDVVFKIEKREVTLTVTSGSKVYGEETPKAYTETGEYKPVDEYEVTYELSSENVDDNNTLTITSTTLNENNYIVKIVPANITVTPATLTITPNDNQSKVYGEDEPVFTYEVSGYKLGDKDLVSGSLSRVEGEDANTYEILQGDLELISNNYTLLFVSDVVFKIEKREVTLTVTSGSKVYGEETPKAYTETGKYKPVDEYEVTYKLSSENVNDNNTLTITSTTLNENNYNVEIVPANITINPKPIDVMYVIPSKITYGDNYVITGYASPEFNDTLVLTNINVKDVGEYSVIPTFVNENKEIITNNYIINDLNDKTYKIEPSVLRVIANPQNFIYGDGAFDPLDYNVLGLKPEDIKEDVLEGTMTINSGYNGGAGSYQIKQGTLSTNNNYTIQFIQSYLTVEKRMIVLSYSGDLVITYGTLLDVEAELIDGSLVTGHKIYLNNTDEINAGQHMANALIKDSSNNDVSNNYDVYNDIFYFTIKKKELTIQILDVTRQFGEYDDVLNYSSSVSGFVPGDDLNSLGFVNGKELEYSNNATIDSSPGEYIVWISRGYQSSNYSFTYLTGKLLIVPASLKFEIDNIEVIYDGLEKELSLDDVVVKDPINHEVVDLELIITYKLGDDFVTPLNAGVYIFIISFEGNDLYEATQTTRTLKILKREVTLTVTSGSKVYGEETPKAYTETGEYKPVDEYEVTYELSSENVDDNNTLTITSTTLNENNYIVKIVPANITVTPATLTITPNDNQSKVYGEDEPVFTYEVSGYKLGDKDLVTGSLSRVEGKDANTYEILQGDLKLISNNYTLLFVSDVVFKIEKREVTLTVTSGSKVYGEETPKAYTETGEYKPVDEYEVTYELSSENVDDNNTLTITSTTLNENNYIVKIVPANITITPATLTITPKDNQSKVYGEDDPIFTYEVSGYKLGDKDLVTGSLSRVEGKDANTYEILQGDLKLISNNYTLLFVSDVVFKIEKREVTLTVTSGSKVYGEETPKAYTETGEYKPVDEYEVTYELSSENVDDNNTLTITSTTLNENNYIVKIVPANITVTPATLTITPNDNQSKVYGEDEPVFTYEVSGYKLGDKDLVTGSLSRVEGKDANTYEILQGDLKLISNNYTLLFVSDVVFKIEKREVTLTVTSGSKVYGEETPKAYTETGEYKPVDEYEVTYELSSENVDDNNTLTITSTTLNENNYIVKIVPANITVTPATLTITPNDNQSKVYGEDEPVFTYEVSGYKLGDKDLVTGSLSRVEGKDANTYEILQGDLKLISNNYTLLFVSDVVFKIEKREVTLTVTSGSKVYGEETPKAYTETGEYKPVDEYEVTYELSSENVDDNNTLTITSTTLNENNYIVKIVPANITVTPATLTITPKDNQSKVYGEDDPIFTYEVSGYKLGDKDLVTGSLSRVEGKDANTYEILQGDLKLISNNYTLLFVSDVVFKIEKREVTLTVTSGSKVYGEETPKAYTETGEYKPVDEYEVTYELSSENVDDNNTLTITSTTLNENNYIVKIVPANITVTPATLTITPNDNQSKVYGEDEPVFTYEVSGYKLGDKDLVTGSLSRVEGKDANTYEILQGDLKLISNNYTLLFVSDVVFKIEKREVTLTVTSGSKVYGEETPKAYTETGEYKPVDEYEVTYELSSENVDDNNTLTITSTTLNENNYIVKIVPANITVTPATLTITPNDNQSKVYGEDEPVFTYEVSGYKLGDKDLVTGSLSRVEGKDANTYEILQGDLKLISNNYTLLFVSDVVFKIEKREVTLTVTSGSKVYGEETPKAYTETGEYKPVDEYEVTYELSSENVDDNNTLTITSTTLNENNYIVKIVPANITVTPATLTITPNDNQSKVYGEDEPVFTYEVSGYKLGDKDLVTGSLSRVEGKDANTYEILQGDLKLISNNYTLLFVSDVVFKIEKRTVIFGVVNASKIYGENDPDFDYNVSDDALPDSYSIQFERDLGENGGEYEIIIYIKISNMNNYDIRTKNGYLTINKKMVTLTPLENYSKTYGELNDPTFKYIIKDSSTEEIIDSITGDLKRAEGNTVGNYNYLIDELSFNRNNYDVEITDNYYFKILPKKITFDYDPITYTGENLDINIRINGLINDDDVDASITNIIKDAGTYQDLLVEISGDDVNNYTHDGKITIIVHKAIATLTSSSTDEPTNDYQTYSENYTNNNVVIFENLDKFNINFNDSNVTKEFELIYKIGDKIITSLDLSNGGTTYVVNIIATATNPNFEDIEQTVVYKFKSVMIGDNYYTIEDALAKATSANDEILVRANTKFAEEDIAELIYRYDSEIGYNLSGKITVSYYQNENYITEFNSAGVYSDATTRQTPDVTLILSENLKLNVKNNAEIFINAERYVQSTNVTGIVDGKKYGVLYVEENSEITFESGGKFTNYGFSAGPGIMYSLPGSTVVEFMTIFDYKGGTRTSNVFSDAAPILYFAPLAITNEIEFVKGSNYRMYTFATASSSRHFAEVDILKVGNNNPMFDLKSGFLTKSVLNGKAKFVFDNAEVDLLGNIKIDLAVTFNASGKDLALGAFYDIHINNSIINQEASIMLIGGSTITVDATSTININNKLYIDEKYEYYTIQASPLNNLTGVAKNNSFYDYDFIYNQTQTNNYVVYDPITNNSANRSTLHIDPDANISIGDKGKVAGYVNETLFNLLNPLLSEDKKTFTVKRIKEVDGLLTKAAATDVRVNFDLIDNWSEPPKEEEEEETGGGGSPFIYSEDSNGNIHFEHEPISFKLLKTVEGTSYGTLRLLQAQNGLYYIQVIEEGSSITVLNNVQLYAVDYLDDGSVLDLFFDIAGNPHTIREKLRPVSFIDQYGNSYLNEVLDKDGVVAQYDQTNDSTLSYFTATFDRPNNNRYAKFMFSVQDSGNSTVLLEQLFASFNAPQNLWWLDQSFMANSTYTNIVNNIFDSIQIKVQVWNGTEWISQGSIEPGTYLMESFLVELDLEGINSEQIQVRLVAPSSSAYLIDDVAIDFSENLPMIINEMNLVSAILNGDNDVLDILSTVNNEYVTLDYKEAVRFGFTGPELEEGYSRGFGVNMTGYIYNSGARVNDPLQELMEGKTFEEIKQIIIDSGRQELIDDIPIVEEFYNTILSIGSQDYETLLELLFSSLNPPGEDD